LKLNDLCLNVNILFPKKLLIDAIMNEKIFDEDLEKLNISDNIIYIEVSIISEINPIVEYDVNCLYNNLMFTRLTF